MRAHAFAPLIALPLVAGAAAAQPVSGAPTVTRDEVRAIVAQMLADADTRSSLSEAGAVAGYDRRFFIASADGRFRLNVSGFGQFRYTLDLRDRANEEAPGGYPTAGDDFNAGFAVRAAKVRFDGHVIDPALQYVVRLSFDTSIVRTQTVTFDPDADPTTTVTNTNSDDARLRFDDVLFRYAFTGKDGGYIKWGQYKLPFLKEELNSETFTMSADRGFVNVYFSQGRSQGVSVGYEDASWWLEGAISDGIRTANTPYGSTFNKTNDLALTGRVEHIFAGTRDQLKDYTSLPDESFAAQAGGAVLWQYQNNDPSVTSPDRSTGKAANRSILGVTIDGQLECHGWSLYAAGVMGYTDLRNVVQSDGTTDDQTLTDWGVTVQGAWRFTEKCEAFVRWDGLFLDEDRNLSDRDEFSFVTFGFNHYFAGHAAKLTIDCAMSTNHTVGLTRSTSGWLSGNVINLNSADATGMLGTARGLETAIRVQAQVMF